MGDSGKTEKDNN